jgi:hypothetical protein
MRIDRGLLNWGVFLILLGAIPLAVDQGWIAGDFDWWRLWPLILVGIGVGIVLSRTRAAALGGLIVATTFGLMFGGLLAGGLSGLPNLGVGCVGDTATTAFPTRDGDLSGSSATVDLAMDCGDMTVRTAAGTGWTVAGTADEGRAPTIDAAADRLSVRDETPEGDLFRERSRWEVTLPTGPTLDLAARVNAGSATLDLAGAGLTALRLTVNAGDGAADLTGATVDSIAVDVNAGSASLDLPAATIDGEVSVNAGSAELCAAPGTAWRVTTNDNVTASFDFEDAGLVEVATDVWESPDWATATARIGLSVSAVAGSIAIDPEDGCK